MGDLSKPPENSHSEVAPDAQAALTPTDARDQLQAADERKPPPGINMRMAMAGRYILEGRSTRQALLKAGYARSTARKPKHAGLSAERCLLEARKLDRSADPRTLLRESRAVAIRQVRAFAGLDDDDLLDTKAVRAIPRLLETAERYHGEKPVEAETQAARDFVQRATMMHECLRELQRRGLVAGHENADSREDSGD